MDPAFRSRLRHWPLARPSIEFYRALGAFEMSGWHVYRLTGEALEAAAAQGADVPLDMA